MESLLSNIYQDTNRDCTIITQNGSLTFHLPLLLAVCPHLSDILPIDKDVVLYSDGTNIKTIKSFEKLLYFGHCIVDSENEII